MTRQDAERIADLLIEVGGRRGWVLIWDGGENGRDEVIASVPPSDLPQLVCGHLLRLIRQETDEVSVLRTEQ